MILPSTGCDLPAAAETGRADDLRPNATDRRRARRRGTATSRASPSPGTPGVPGEVVEEDAVPDARRVARPGHLERHESAVVADHRVGRLVTRVLVEVRQ